MSTAKQIFPTLSHVSLKAIVAVHGAPVLAARGFLRPPRSMSVRTTNTRATFDRSCRRLDVVTIRLCPLVDLLPPADRDPLASRASVKDSHPAECDS